ncbi:MAG: hypothetical protein FJ291_14975 [Planctomycetes bacterium]|nr:hypothetical protein [Planctomycetota bacterium]
MTMDQIRRKGLAALHRALGPVGMVRFLQYSETGSGDYTKERHGWLGNPDVRDLVKESRGLPKKRRRRA